MKNIALINPRKPGDKEEISDLIRDITDHEQIHKNGPFAWAMEFHRSYGQRLSIYSLANIRARIKHQKRNPNSFPQILEYFTKKDLEKIYRTL